jgi:hypothetical protein
MDLRTNATEPTNSLFQDELYLLWLQFAQCLKKNVVSPETCILGRLSGDHFYIINICIIIIKYFIFTCKLQNTTPVFRECVEQIKYYKKLDFDSLHLCTPKQSILFKE